MLKNAIVQRAAAVKGKDDAKELQESLGKLQKSAEVIGEGKDDELGLGPANRDLSRYLIMVEEADIKPATSAKEAVQEACTGLQKSLYAWTKLNGEDVAKANSALSAAHQALLPVAAGPGISVSCAP
jgi:hypothetical protein